MQGQPHTKESKQIFLRNEILEGGIDPQTFMDYMGTVKNQGENIDIDNWTIDELTRLVHDFKMQIKADTQTLEEVKKSQMRDSQQMISKILKSNIMKKEKVNYDKGLWDYEMNNQQECKTLPRPFKFNPKIKPKAQILNWEVRSHGGFFLGFGATKQLWLKIETNFTQKAIQRSNSDFQWYRNALLKFNPGFYVPPLYELRTVEPQDKKGLSHRSKQIERFLNSIIQYEYLIQSQISKIFLTQLDHTKFTNYKNKQRSVSLQKNVGRIETLEGKLEMQISKRNQSFTKNSSLFGKVAQECYTQIESHLGKVLSDMQTLSKHVLYVSNSCGVLHQKYTKICGLNEIKDSNMENLMIFLYNMLSNIGKNIKEHIGVIKEFSDEFVRNNIKSWEQFILHDKRYQRQVQTYLTYKSDLLRKKERFFTDFSKWQLESEKQVEKIARMNLSVMSKDEVFAMMFPRENKIQEEMRIWVAYLNKAYESSFTNLLKQEEYHIKQRLKAYIDRSNLLSNETYFSKELKQLIAVE